MNKHFKARHDYFTAGLNALPGFKVLPAAGTFYAWCDVSEAIRMRGLADDNEFAEFLLDKGHGGGRARHGLRRTGATFAFRSRSACRRSRRRWQRMGKALAGA